MKKQKIEKTKNLKFAGTAKKTAPPNPRGSGKRMVTAALAVLLFMLSAIAYYPVLNNNFHLWDDDIYVKNNEKVVNGLTADNIEWAFSTTYFGFYYPFTWMSHMADVQFYGLNARGHYATNIFLHSFNSVLLFLLFFLATNRRIQSFAVAALFALHPMNVESVAWIAERKNLLSVFFLLFALIFYVLRFKNGDSDQKRFLFTSAYYLFFAMGLMSKSSIVVFPVILLVIDLWPLRRFSFDDGGFYAQRKLITDLVLEKVPLFILSTISGILTIVAQKEIATMSSLSYIPFSQRIGEALLGYGFYLKKLFLPFDLCALYFHHRGNYPLYLPFSIFVLLAVLTCVFFILRKSAPALIAGWIFFLASLLPVIGLIQVGNQAYADRYVYFPYWGLFAIFAFGVNWEFLISKSAGRKILLAAISLAAVLFLFFATRAQLATWKDDEALFSNMTRVSPRCSIGYFQLATSYQQKGDLETAGSLYQKALECSDDDIKLDPKSGVAYYNKACALLNLKRGEEALTNLNLALKNGFNSKEAKNLFPLVQGLVLSNLVKEGKKYAEQGMWDKAEADFRKAVEAAPDKAEVWSYLGYIMDHKNDFGEAEYAYQKALEINPSLDVAVYDIALIDLRKKDKAKALERLQVLESMNSPYAENLRSVINAQ
jgi:protein O-mannosyl-transferase